MHTYIHTHIAGATFNITRRGEAGKICRKPDGDIEIDRKRKSAEM
jgi:hypothetical protein